MASRWNMDGWLPSGPPSFPDQNTSHRCWGANQQRLKSQQDICEIKNEAGKNIKKVILAVKRSNIQ
jgi:hypothetical protein